VTTAERHALVTGGGSGIGLAIAQALGRGGWKVTIAGRNRRRLEGALDSIAGARAETCDVTDPDSVAHAVSSAVRAQGPVQLLVNNAGVVASAPFEKLSLEAWRQSLDLNLMGAVHCVQAVLPQMKASGWGRIVNISSTAGLIGYPYVSPYVAAKHALVGLTKALALELARSGITVNAVCPGYTDTAMIAAAAETISARSKRTKEEALAVFASANPQGRLIAPQEVAAAVVWLASDEARAVNGIALPIASGEVA
jgi:NAD(P)-dependent dehydrogenase (short-subunit alcohol dehydrogenase family)